MSNLDEAIREIFSVIGELVRGDGLPSQFDEHTNGRKRAARRMLKQAVSRAVRLKNAVDIIRKAMNEGGAK